MKGHKALLNIKVFLTLSMFSYKVIYFMTDTGLL